MVGWSQIGTGFPLTSINAAYTSANLLDGNSSTNGRPHEVYGYQRVISGFSDGSTFKPTIAQTQGLFNAAAADITAFCTYNATAQTAFGVSEILYNSTIRPYFCTYLPASVAPT